MAINVSAGQSSLTSSAGTTTAVTSADTVAIQAGQAAVRPADLIPASPANTAAILGAGALIPVGFSWSTSGAIGPFTVEASRSRDFESRRIAESEGLSLDISLESGAWFWRIRDAAGNYSRISQLTVLSDTAPAPLAPATGSAFNFRSAPPPVSLAWTAVPQATGYDYQLASAPDFTTILSEGRASAPSIVLSGLPAGSLYWRVRARYDFAALAGQAWSSPASFSLNQVAIPEAPRPNSPPAAFRVLAVDSASLLFAWSVMPDAASYELAIWPSAAGNAPTLPATWQGSGNVYRPDRNLPEGDYFWSLRTVAADGVASSWSAPRNLVVQGVQQPQAAAPLDGHEIEGAATTRLQVAWRGYAEAVVLVSRSPDFSQLVSSTAGDANRATIELPGPGTYYWAVRDPRLPETVPESVRSIRVLPPLAAPRLVTPAPAARLQTSATTAIRFAWQVDPGISYSRFSLRQTRDQRLVFESQTADSSLELPGDIFETGDYQWTVQAFAQSGTATARGSPAGIASFNVQSLRVPPASRVLEPPPDSRLPGLTAARSGLRLAWSASETGMSYLVRLLRTDGSLVSETRTALTAIQIPNPGPGSYRWSVAGQATDGAELPALESSFQVDAIPALGAVSVQAPRANQALDVTNADFVRFSWTALRDANAYEISLTDLRTGNLVFTRIVEAGQELLYRELDKLDVAAYSFRIRALLVTPEGTIERSGPVRTIPFSITITTGGSPVLTTPKEIYVQNP
ncbi:MAG TPA: hypothetical protein DCX65_03650 [Spirochaetaceae bacterium]|nr:hypothetical protein [Spirochaetaceae bacterium]